MAITEALRYAVFERDSWACQYCLRGAEQGVELTLDHVRPQALGGPDVAQNLLSCCAYCNSVKRDMGLAVWSLYLRERGQKTGPMVARVKRQLAKSVDLRLGARIARGRKHHEREE